MNTIFLVGIACQKQNIKLFKYIINQYLKYVVDNANIGIHYNEALIGACRSGNIVLIKYVINMGADCFDDALYNSFLIDNEEVVDLILQQSITRYGLESCLTPACKMGNSNIIKKILAKLSKC